MPQKPVFPKTLFLKIYGFKDCGKNVHILKIQIARLVLIVEKRYAYR